MLPTLRVFLYYKKRKKICFFTILIKIRKMKSFFLIFFYLPWCWWYIVQVLFIAFWLCLFGVCLVFLCSIWMEIFICFKGFCFRSTVHQEVIVLLNQWIEQYLLCKFSGGEVQSVGFKNGFCVSIKNDFCVRKRTWFALGSIVGSKFLIRKNAHQYIECERGNTQLHCDYYSDMKFKKVFQFV